MSLAIFLTLCILGVDFLIYVLFEWTFGDRRRALQRKVQAQRLAMKEAPRPTLVRNATDRRTRNESGTDWRVYGAQLTVLRRLE
jgi:hypothetical protein